jgi:hypothetical protein
LLALYNFRISYIKGTENARADALSRKPEYEENKTYELYMILKQEDNVLVFNKVQLVATRSILNIDLVRKGVKLYYDSDPTAKCVLESESEGFTIENNIIYFQGKIYIPAAMAKPFTREYHELPAHGYQGIAKTHARIRKDYYFLRMSQIVEEVIGKCDTCIRNKSARHAPYG